MAETTTEPVIDTPTTTSEATGSEETKYKQVFVGNLPFRTTEKALIEFFEAAGKVEKASVIMRGRRPLGYGFVSFETPEEAEKAAKELDKKDFNGRDVNVEIAKPRTSVNGATKPRPHTKRRTRRGAKEADGAAEQDDDQVVIDDKENVDGAKDSEQPAKLKNKKKKQAQRKTDQPARIDLAEEQGEPSKTTLFVGNLPFTTDDDGLKDILKNYRVKSAHVVKRKTGRSKGFGFVEMEDEAEQQKVLEEMKTVTVDGREVSIKVSVSVPHTASDGVEHSEDAPQEAET